MRKKYISSSFTFGFELEGLLRFNSRYDYGKFKKINTKTHNILFMNKLKKYLNGFFKQSTGNITRDSTITSDILPDDTYETFEYRSPILKTSFNDFKNLICLFNDLPSTNIITNSSCGFHVHIGYDNFELVDMIWGLFNMIISNDYVKFLKLNNYRFYSNEYAMIDFINQIKRFNLNNKDNIINVMRKLAIPSSKYKVFNIHRQGTMEWRGPRTFLNRQNQKLNKSFVFLLRQFVSDFSKNINLNENKYISYQEFLKIFNEEFYPEYNHHISFTKIITQTKFNNTKIIEKLLVELKDKHIKIGSKKIHNIIHILKSRNIRITTINGIEYRNKRPHLNRENVSDIFKHIFLNIDEYRNYYGNDILEILLQLYPIVSKQIKTEIPVESFKQFVFLINTKISK